MRKPSDVCLATLLSVRDMLDAYRIQALGSQ